MPTRNRWPVNRRTDAFQNIDNLAKEQAQKHQLDTDKLQACMQKQDETAVRASMAEGDKLGVDSTPTLFINGERFTGAVPEAELRAALDRALADSGQQAAGECKKLVKRCEVGYRTVSGIANGGDY